MKIGDTFGEGIIIEMEPDPDNPAFWIKVLYKKPREHVNVVRFTNSHNTMIKQEKDIVDKHPLTYEEYNRINEEFKTLKQENIRLKIENETLRRIRNV